MSDPGSRRRLWCDWIAVTLAALLTVSLWKRSPPDATLRTQLLMLLLAPLVEEALAREVLQRRLWRIGRLAWGWGRYLSLPNLLVAAMFAAAHLPGSPVSLVPGYFLASLALGYFWEAHRSLLAPVALHAYFNALFLFL